MAKFKVGDHAFYKQCGPVVVTSIDGDIYPYEFKWLDDGVIGACRENELSITRADAESEALIRADERKIVLAAVLAEMESMYHPDEAAETLAAIEERLEAGHG